jgi:hypothetical protein
MDHCFLYACVGTVDILVTPRTSCYSLAKASYTNVTTDQKAPRKNALIMILNMQLIFIHTKSCTFRIYRHQWLHSPCKDLGPLKPEFS